MQKIITAVLAGIIGKIIISAMLLVCGFLTNPAIFPQNMLIDLMGIHSFSGSIIDFVTGIILAFIYVYWADYFLKIGNSWIKGTIYGIIIFIFAQITYVIVLMSILEKLIVFKMAGNLVAHIIFGIVIVLAAGNAHCSRIICYTNNKLNNLNHQ